MERPRVDAACGGNQNSKEANIMSPKFLRIAVVLGLLSAIGPFAIDMYLPAFNAISQEFDASPIAVQQTLSAYLFAYAFMMLWHGSLSDALGRRPIILGGLVIYALASLGCAISGNIESLWLFRTLQGISAGSGLVVGRAIIRDRYQGPEAQRLMSQTTLVFGIAPALAPVIGGAVLNLLGSTAQDSCPSHRPIRVRRDATARYRRSVPSGQTAASHEIGVPAGSSRVITGIAAPPVNTRPSAITACTASSRCDAGSARKRSSASWIGTNASLPARSHRRSRSAVHRQAPQSSS